MSGFDPDAFLGEAPAGAPAPAASFDPDAFLGVESAPVAPAVSKTESFVRGAGQGATLGFLDELTGGIESLFTSKSYQQARDESRAANEAARAANPLTYTAGDVAGSVATAFVPGGAVAKGATLAAKVGAAAATGAVAGIGYSDANDAGGLAKDATTGAAFGAVGGAVFGGIDKALAKLAATAPERASKRVVQEIVGSASPKARDKLLGDAGKNTQRIGETVLKDPEMLAAYRNPTKLSQVVKSRLAEEGEKLTPIYESVDKVSRGVEVDKVRSALDAAVAKHKSKFRGGLADMVQSKADALSGQVGDSKFLSATQMRDVVSSFQDDAFAGSFMNPTAAKKAMREVSSELRDMLNKHVEDVGGRAKIANASEVRKINGRVADLINLRDVVERSATRANGATKVSPFSLKNAELLTSNPLALAAGAAMSPQVAGAVIAGKAALGGARKADNALAAAVLRGRAPNVPSTAAIQRAATTEGTATVARKRSSLSDIAAMAQQGASASEIERVAQESGIDKAAVKKLIKAFGASS